MVYGRMCERMLEIEEEKYIRPPDSPHLHSFSLPGTPTTRDPPVSAVRLLSQPLTQETLAHI